MPQSSPPQVPRLFGGSEITAVEAISVVRVRRRDPAFSPASLVRSPAQQVVDRRCRDHGQRQSVVLGHAHLERDLLIDGQVSEHVARYVVLVIAVARPPRMLPPNGEKPVQTNESVYMGMVTVLGIPTIQACELDQR
jgi:hypothetical protein